MKYTPFVSLILDILLIEKWGKKEQQQKKYTTEKKTHRKSFLSQCVEKSELRPLPGLDFRVHLRLSNTDSDSDKEAADMGCSHWQIKLPTQQPLETTDNIAHSSVNTVRFRNRRLSLLKDSTSERGDTQ
ncbi:hypothetical protein AVEN_185499-1 [Araneus ventricosus]|uniref:Uncharacterized protein n=1 Tax=Araneus ventricosus TaxID=182803 RepID=A0A4Y2GDP4_ARAVE|nr:hypothetical protein AVEN_185499-1 [Araneus ventricosus]